MDRRQLSQSPPPKMQQPAAVLVPCHFYLWCSSWCGLSHARFGRNGCGLYHKCNHPVVEKMHNIIFLEYFTLLVMSPGVFLTSSPSLFLVRQLQAVTMGRWSGQIISRFKAPKLPSLPQDSSSWARTELTPAWRLKLWDKGTESSFNIKMDKVENDRLRRL